MEPIIYTDHGGHLASSDLRALHEFAGKLGLKRDQFRDHRKYPHYDITIDKKREAIERGAKLVKTKILIRKCYNRHILRKHQEIKITQRLSISRDIINKMVKEQLEAFKGFWTRS